MKSVRINVSGRVQGVGFRYMTKLVADEFGVKGVVWNEANGSVSIEASGTESQLETFCKIVKSSPAAYGRVDSFVMEEIPETQKCSGFQIVWD